MKALMTLLLVLAVLLGGCAKDDGGENATPDNFTSLYGGKPFKGTAKAVLTGEGLEDLEWNGDGTISLIESSTDSVSMVFLADFGNQSEINFKLRGKVEGTNFQLEDDESSTSFRIIDEKITGSVDNDAQEMRFEGTMKKEGTRLTMRVNFREAVDPFPKGSILTLNFDTDREVTDGDDESGCQMRLVPIWSPSGMTMGMVPDC